MISIYILLANPFKKIKSTLIISLFVLVSLVCISNSATYYMSPTGNDSNNGTAEGTPWATFSHAWGVLQPGDTLILLDGVYYQGIVPNISGTSGNRITIKAKNDGKAIIDGEFVRRVVNISYVGGGGRYFTIEGIFARNSSASVYDINYSNVILRRCTGFNAYPGNYHVFSIWVKDGQPTLIEDCIASGAGRKMFMAYDSQYVTFRRCFAAWGLPDYGADHENGVDEQGIQSYWGDYNIIENCIAYGRCSGEGITMMCQYPGPHLRNCKVLGCIATKIAMTRDGQTLQFPHKVDVWAYQPGIRCGFNFFGPGELTNNVFQDIFSYGNAGCGLGCAYFASTDITNNKLIRATLKNNGLGDPPPPEGAGAEYTVMNKPVLTQFAEITDCYIEDDPQYQGGGAVIVNRYVDGVLTSEPLWPWPMEDRVYEELGIRVTTEMMGLLGLSHGSASKVVMTAIPQKIQAAGTSVIDAKIYDNNNLPVYTSNAQVTFNITSGGGSLLGSNPVNVVEGVASITYQASGSVGTITISATSSGLTEGLVNIEVIDNNSPNAPNSLMCSGSVDPTGLSDFYPVLSWTFNDSDFADTQTAARILVADNMTTLNADTGNVWDSGKTEMGSASELQYSGALLQTNEMYYWKVMSWDSYDTEGAYSQAGTFSMASTKSNYGLQLNGSRSFIKMGLTDTLNIHSGNANGLTIEAWVKRIEDGPIVARYVNGSPSNGYEMAFSGGKLRGRTKAGNYTWYTQESNITISTGTWNHLAFVVDGTTNKGYLFVDGQDVSATPSADVFMPDSQGCNFYVGFMGWGSSIRLVIDELRVSNTARYTSNFAPPNVPFTSDSNTKGLWHFDEGHGTISEESSGNSNETVTINNPTWVSGYFSESPVEPVITIVNPNGGETWQTGYQANITWTRTGSYDNVKIELSTDGGTNWTELISDTANDGSETITVPDSASTTCRIQISETDGSPTDMSNNNFTIASAPSPEITVTSPNGGNTWQVGTQAQVTWTSQGTVGNAVGISLSTDGGTNWSILVSATANDGSEAITAPDSQSTSCRIKVEDVSGSPSDTSDNNFTITTTPITPEITVTSPNGGDTWQAGNQEQVTWSWQGSVGNAVGIDLSTDGGSNWTALVSNTTNDGTETITAPNSPSTTCKIRIQVPSGSPGDTSNMNFTIKESPNPPSISVDKTDLDFEEVDIGETSTLDFQITNTGGGTLSGSITTDKKWIEVQPTSFESNTILINVTVDNSMLNQSEGQYTGIITITSNGGNVSVEVTLVATCVLAKPNPYNPTKGNLTFFGDGIVPGETTIKIYTLDGELVKILSIAKSRAFEGQWDGTNENGEQVTSGIYMYTYESPNEQGVGKFTIVR